jgi:hypothetical protein
MRVLLIPKAVTHGDPSKIIQYVPPIRNQVNPVIKSTLVIQ